jgi:tRNA threonylcarbamoyladenosine biosynthesis protein TsaB
MSLILHIDTALDNGGVCLSIDRQVIAMASHSVAQQHASFLQTAISEIFEQARYKLNQIDAVAVSNGPGSYTGLRVGLASAKGLCFAMDKPLILLSTLEIMTYGMLKELGNTYDYYCPMIDARREEVFTAMFNNQLVEIEPPHAAILSPSFMSDFLARGQVLFFGSGAKKWKAMDSSQDIHASLRQHTINDMVPLAFRDWQEGRFHSVAYSEPFYTKAFYTNKGVNEK